MRKQYISRDYFEENKEEISEYIERTISRYPIYKMAKHFNVSVGTMRKWMNELGYYGGCRENNDNLNVKEIGELIGIPSPNFIYSWKRNGFEVSKNHGYSSVTFDQLFDFMKEHPNLWDANLCDKTVFGGYDWFKEILEKGNDRYSRRRWTEEEKSLLIVLWKNNKSTKEISQRIGRTQNAVQKKISELTTLM